jgi:uncharacterized protein
VCALFKFFLLTFILSWVLWTAAAAVVGWDFSQSSGLALVSGFLYLLGVFAPALVALALTAHAQGRAGTLTLLRRTVQFPGSARWYLFAVGYFAIIKLAVAIIYRLAMGTWPAFDQTPWFITIVATAISTPVQAGEEIGWRGYALPRLSSYVGLPVASLILGVVWATWHLPFFLIAGVDKSGQSFPVYLLGTTALSVVMAWLYWRTNGSLMLTMLMHAAINNTNIVPTRVAVSTNPWQLRTSLTAWITTTLLWGCAAYFLIQMRRSKLEQVDQPRRDMQEIAPAQSTAT